MYETVGGLPDQRVHAPNEFHRLSSFRRAQVAHALFLERFAEQGV